MDWSIYIADVAEEVTLVHRRNEFRGALDSVEKFVNLSYKEKSTLLLRLRLKI